MSASAAKGFRKRERPLPPLAREAEARGITLDQARDLRLKEKQRTKEARAEALRKIKAGEMSPLAFPPHLQKITNESGWDAPVPIRSPIGIGIQAPKLLREFMPISSVGAAPEFDLHETVDRTFFEQMGGYVCYLDSRWDFLEIETNAKRRGGYEYAGRNFGTILQVVVGAMHDLEIALRNRKPNLAGVSVADFWQSWQVERHIADFCIRLAGSSTARNIAGPGIDVSRAVGAAFDVVKCQLSAFTGEMRQDISKGGGATRISRETVQRTIAHFQSLPRETALSAPIATQQAQAVKDEPTHSLARNRKPTRLAGTIRSLEAARRMEAFIESSTLNQTQFASHAGTTDRTLREFRRTGKVRRSIFEGIARVMGLTVAELSAAPEDWTGR